MGSLRRRCVCGRGLAAVAPCGQEAPTAASCWAAAGTAVVPGGASGGGLYLRMWLGWGIGVYVVKDRGRAWSRFSESSRTSTHSFMALRRARRVPQPCW